MYKLTIGSAVADVERKFKTRGQALVFANILWWYEGELAAATCEPGYEDEARASVRRAQKMLKEGGCPIELYNITIDLEKI